MRASMSIPAGRLRQLQDLVKQHNLRFEGNPFVAGNDAHVCISSEHLPAGGCNEFWRDWNRLTTPIRETTTPTWKCVLRRIGLKL